MLDKIKRDIFKCENKVLKIKINNIRNKSECVEGVVSEIYDRLFIVECFDGIKRSFNYSDILTGNVEIECKTC